MYTYTYIYIYIIYIYIYIYMCIYIYIFICDLLGWNFGEGKRYLKVLFWYK